MTAAPPEPPPKAAPPLLVNGRLGMVERIMVVLRQLTVENVLVLGLLAVILVPTWLVYRFLTDEKFRHEFMTTVRVIDAQVPCQVVSGNITGVGDRHSVVLSYDVRGRVEFLIVLRGPNLLGDSEIQNLCAMAHEEVELMQQAIKQRNVQPAK